jgi:hypothetical protein
MLPVLWKEKLFLVLVLYLQIHLLVNAVFVARSSVLLSPVCSTLCNEFNFQRSVDCCDGSDEYDGKVKCPITCWEAGKVARDKLKKKIATYQEGVALRQQEVEQAKLGLAKDEAELSRLKAEEKILKGLVQQLKGMVLTR